MPNRFSAFRHAGIAAALLCLTAALAGLAAPAHAAAAEAEQAAVTARLKEFMNRYEQNDQDGVIALVDAKEFTIYGGPGEKATTADGIKAMMTRSFSQWQTAKFSDYRDFDVRLGKDLATVYFQFSFTAGDGQTLPIRVVTTWHKVGKEWMLTQCASWVVQGQ